MTPSSDLFTFAPAALRTHGARTAQTQRLRLRTNTHPRTTQTQSQMPAQRYDLISAKIWFQNDSALKPPPCVVQITCVRQYYQRGNVVRCFNVAHLRHRIVTAMRFAAVALAALGLCVGAAPLSACQPEAFFINYMNEPSQMAVSWSTNCSSTTQVQFGFSSNSLNSLAPGNSSTYTFQPSQGSTYTSPHLHHAILTGLPLNALVFYQVGGDKSGFSTVMNFTSSIGPALRADGRSSTFAIVGDLGQTSNSLDTLNHLAAGPLTKFAAMVFPGDLSYADSVETRWQTFANLIAPVAQTLPWMATVGNHEHEYCSTGQTFTPYQTRYLMPSIYYGTPQESQELFYSFENSGVHWVLLSSYSDFTEGSTQYNWLVADLASVDRSVTPWLIVLLHAPWYNSNTAHQGEGEAMRQAMESVLYNGHVDAVFTGHVHAYERCHRSYNMQPDAAGPYYITIGDGGNREGLASDWQSPQPAWSAFRQASYGHGELEVVNATALHWTWHQNPDLEPTIADELWIVKGQSDGPTGGRALRAGSGITAQPKFARKA